MHSTKASQKEPASLEMATDELIVTQVLHQWYLCICVVRLLLTEQRLALILHLHEMKIMVCRPYHRVMK